jgi:hypothetical protein
VVAIRKISVSIKTGDRPDAGIVIGAVFLGIGGREFRLDSEEPDFRQNSEAKFSLGEPVFPGMEY